MEEKRTLESKIEELSIKLNETMLETDINDPKYLESTINLVLTSVKDTLNFNCAEFLIFKNLDGSIPKISEIGTDPRKKTDMRLHWITGVGYEESYYAQSNVFNITSPKLRGLPFSLFNPQFDFEPLILYDNENAMKELEINERMKEEFFQRNRELYEKECNPEDYPRGGFSEFFYQIYIPITRKIAEGREMIGLMCIDSPLDIPLNEPPSQEKMDSVMRMVKLAQIPIMNAAMVYELKTTNNKLETTLTELKDAQATIVEQEKMITEQSMAGGFAHEIRNALSPISIYCALLLGSSKRIGLIDKLDQLEKLDLPEELRSELRGIKTGIKEDVLKIKNQDEYALDVTGMIMEYGKIESEKAFEEIKICSLLEEIIDSHKDQFNEKGISFSNSPNYDGIIYSNPTQVREVIENLIINSEYAVEKSGKKEISLAVEYLKDGDSRYNHGNSVRISVSDSGCGIEDAIKDKVFMPFFTTRPDKKGAGLGLPTSRRIAKLYDGDLLFESEPGNTIFTLYLPVGENKSVEVKSDAR
ncbi:MAG: HAMP domain-containing sensor histidine kinase [Candidatus Woesearchaeota archaeon]|nr:HAMP domain-containing sensor histidine kinase [Candidatus Woesearchaeota archaeon]